MYTVSRKKKYQTSIILLDSHLSIYAIYGISLSLHQHSFVETMEIHNNYTLVY